MKTDAQVLDEAIASLEQEGMWCQGALFQADYNGEKCGVMGSESVREMVANDVPIMGMCAEGAIRLASGMYHLSGQEMWWSWRSTLEPRALKHLRQLNSQVKRIESAVTEHLKALRPDIRQAHREATPGFGLWFYNDSSKMTASDIILAMKHAREELS